MNWHAGFSKLLFRKGLGIGVKAARRLWDEAGQLVGPNLRAGLNTSAATRNSDVPSAKLATAVSPASGATSVM
jgi:hypothetical protein